MKDIAACQEFLEKRRLMIRGSVRRFLWRRRCINPDSHSEDVSSEVTLKVIKHWDGLNTPEHVLHAIIFNAVFDHIEKCRREVAQEIHDWETPCFVQAGHDPEEKLFDLLQSQELLRRLEPTESDIIHLWLDGYSSEDIGKRLGMPSGTVRSIKSRAIVKMRTFALS